MARKQYGAPDRGGVKEGGQRLHHVIVEVAPGRRMKQVAVVAEGVEIKVPRHGEDERQQVGDGHRQQHLVGGRAHVGPREHHHDDDVGHHGDQEEDGRDEAEQHDAVLHRHVAGDIEDVHLR